MTSTAAQQVVCTPLHTCWHDRLKQAPPALHAHRPAALHGLLPGNSDLHGPIDSQVVGDKFLRVARIDASALK